MKENDIAKHPLPKEAPQQPTPVAKEESKGRNILNILSALSDILKLFSR